MPSRATARASLMTALFGSGIEPCPGSPRTWRAPSRSPSRRPGSGRTCARRGGARTRRSRRARTRRARGRGARRTRNSCPSSQPASSSATPAKMTSRASFLPCAPCAQERHRRTRSSPPCASCRWRRGPRRSRRGSRRRTDRASSGEASASTTSRCAFSRERRLVARPLEARDDARSPGLGLDESRLDLAARRNSATRSAAGRSCPLVGPSGPRFTVGIRMNS